MKFIRLHSLFHKSSYSTEVAEEIINNVSLKFVPMHREVKEEDVSSLRLFLEQGRGKCLVLTGAGVSTESGIPDYRSEGVGLYSTSNNRPVIFKDFLSDAQIRRRYWARNFTGWPTFCLRRPNVNHHALRMLEEEGIICGVITQNVDNLHGKANSKTVVELHGTAYRVICLSCDYSISRHSFQQELSTLNQPITLDQAYKVNPDGDVTLPEGADKNFVVPDCPKCGGILKPDIVFFGDNVPQKRVGLVREMVRSSDSLLVVGSSLTVYSSYRIVLQAVDCGLPTLIVNIGPTRADQLVQNRLPVRSSQLFLSAFPSLVRISK